MATSSTLHPLGTIEARVNAALLALDGAGDAARSIEYGGPLPLMAYQRTQLTEAVALCRGAVLLLQTAPRPARGSPEGRPPGRGAKRRRGRRLPARTGRRPDARLTTCSKPAENRQVD